MTWQTKTLDSLISDGFIQLTRGKVISKKDLNAHPGDYPVYSSAKDNEGVFGKYGKYMFDEELITWSVDGGGRLFHRRKHKYSVTNVGGILRILKRDILDYRYLFYVLTYLHSQVIFDWVKKAHPSVIRKIYNEIPLPPLSEQKRIVKIFDDVFEKTTKARENTEKNLQNSRELFESYLNGVFANPGKDWEKKKLGDVCSFLNGKAHEKIIDEKGDYIVINSKFIASDGRSYKRTKKQLFPLLVGDIVMVMSDVPNGQALAKCFVIEQDNLYSLNQRICAIRSKHFETKFLYYQLNRNKYLLNFDNGENQTNLRKNDILNCPLFVPPISEQKAIIRKLDSLSEHTEKLEKNYQQKLDDLEELKKSVLSKAFAQAL